MKTFSKCIFFTFLLVAFIACKKSEPKDPPIVPVPVLPDTLGVGWRKIKVDSSESFSDVFFNSNTSGYLAGKNLWKSVDGGNTWTVLLANKRFTNIFVTNDFKGFFLDGNGVQKNSGGLNNFTQTISYPSGSICDVFFPDNTNGFFFTGSTLYKTTDAAATWNIVPFTFSGTSYSALFFINNTSGWLGSGKSTFITNGTTVSPPVMLNGLQPDDKLTSIYAPSAMVIFAATAAGVIFKSTDAGLSFNVVMNLNGNAAGITDLHFLSTTPGYVSNSRFVYKTTDGGATWTKVVSMGSAIIIEIHFIDGTHGWACCNDGSLLIFN